MTNPQPDATAASNGSAANGTRPTYTRGEVADALTKITDQLRAHNTDLPATEWQKLDLPFHESFPHLFVRNMAAMAQVVIGVLWLPVVGIGSLVGLLWSYPLAERAQAGNGTTVAVQWIGPDFHLTPTTAVLLAMAFAACCGSVVQASVVFAIRAGNHTLERGYEAWYFLRPITSLLLGPLFGLATIGGLAAITTGSGAGTSLSLPALVTTGALAGLFTDRVLQQMQRILGATDPDKHASEQETPWTPNSSSRTAGAKASTDKAAGATTVPPKQLQRSVKKTVRAAAKPTPTTRKKAGS